MLILGREEKNVIVDSIEKYNVKECDSCTPNLCLNKGVCQVRNFNVCRKKTFLVLTICIKIRNTYSVCIANLEFVDDYIKDLHC